MESGSRSLQKYFYCRMYGAKKAELPINQKLKMAEDFVKENGDKFEIGRNRWFVALCKNYLKNREKVSELCEQLEQIYLKEILKKDI